ncbi:non-specific serine/threonine protein kinase [Entamoeba marina]
MKIHDVSSDAETRLSRQHLDPVISFTRRSANFKEKTVEYKRVFGKRTSNRFYSRNTTPTELCDDPGIQSDIQRFGLVFHQTIGTGATGSVCYCTNSNGVEMAAKVIETSKIVDCRFSFIAKELNIMKQLQHPNIIKYYDVWITPSRLIIAIELASGDSLFDYILEKGCLQSCEVSCIVHAILSALKYLHSLNIVHRDIKLENIMFATYPNDFNSIRLIDFGFARKVDDDNIPSPTEVGSLAYRSPEMITPGKHGKKVDIWALGVVAYILLSGIPPFKSREKDPSYFQPFWILVNENNQQLSEEIKNGILHIETEFVGVDDMAIEFVSKSLIVNENDRLSAEECLQLDWFKGK